MSETEKALREALERSSAALDDWIHVYADLFCHKKDVETSRARIRENGGVLAYVADVQRQNREALDDAG